MLLVWLFGNLARATYVGSSNWVWPFRYNTCDSAIRHSQEINACNKITHYGVKGSIGRGAPEIDLLEAIGGEPNHRKTILFIIFTGKIAIGLVLILLHMLLLYGRNPHSFDDC